MERELPHMETMILEEFVTIARLGSFSRAAEELNLSQSSLSKHILSLERELGITLLVRSSRRVELSSAGAKLLPIAEEICRLATQFRTTAEVELRSSRSSLHIISIPVMAQYGITALIAAFRQKHPEINLVVEECEQQELPEKLRRGDCDLAFSRVTEQLDAEFSGRVLRQDELVAVLPAGHPLAEEPAISIRQLQGLPLLLMDRNTGLYELYHRLFSEAGLTPNMAYTGHRPENILSLAAQGMGIGLLMQGHVDYSSIEKPGKVEIRKLEPAVKAPICLLWRSDVKLNQAARSFLDAAGSEAEGSLQSHS